MTVEAHTDKYKNGSTLFARIDYYYCVRRQKTRFFDKWTRIGPKTLTILSITVRWLQNFILHSMHEVYTTNLYHANYHFLRLTRKLNSRKCLYFTPSAFFPFLASPKKREKRFFVRMQKVLIPFSFGHHSETDIMDLIIIAMILCAANRKWKKNSKWKPMCNFMCICNAHVFIVISTSVWSFCLAKLYINIIIIIFSHFYSKPFRFGVRVMILNWHQKTFSTVIWFLYIGLFIFSLFSSLFLSVCERQFFSAHTNPNATTYAWAHTRCVLIVYKVIKKCHKIS